jgi:hypothetical protein
MIKSYLLKQSCFKQSIITKIIKMCSCDCSLDTPIYRRCGPSIHPRANNTKWKNCPIRLDTAFWFIKYDADLRMTLEVYIQQAYTYYLEKAKRSPDVAWADKKIGSSAGIRVSSAFTVLGREGIVMRSKHTIKMFSLLKNFIVVNAKLTDNQEINALVQLWINFRREEELSEEKRWRERMTSLYLH